MRGSTIHRAVALCLALGVGGCLGTTPEDAARARLPRGRGENGPEHRPGQPCIVCHTGGLTGNTPAFVIAGTILESAGGRGANGVRVVMRDAVGHDICAQTNGAGNFMVEVDDTLAGPELHEEGQLLIPWDAALPVTVIKISRGSCEPTVPAAGSGEPTMASLVYRDGSCASCHGPETNARSVGPIVLTELP